MATSSVLMRDPTKRRTDTSRFLAAAASFWPSTSVRKMFSRRSVARSVFGESASLRPSTVFPRPSSALYSKTGMGSVEVLGGDRQDLGGGGDPERDLVRAVLHERQHAALDRRLLDRARVDVLQDELPHVVVDEHELVDAGAALVAGVLARGAPLRLVEDLGV